MIMILIAHEALCYELDIEKDEKGFHICRQIGAWIRSKGRYQDIGLLLEQRIT